MQHKNNWVTLRQIMTGKMAKNFFDKYERQSFAKGASVFYQGDAGATAYFIERGKVEISTLEHGHAKTISTLGDGEMFGEMALIDNLKRSATATAVEDTQLIALNRSFFRKKIDSADPVLHLLLRVILKRLRHTMQDSTDSMHTDQFISSGQTLVFDQAQSDALHQIQLDNDLQDALTKNQFALHYQPILNTSNNKIEGFEALIRWNHPVRGCVSPIDFIPAAEKSDLIIPIGNWVIEQACTDLLEFQRAQDNDEPPLFMSVNVSPRQIQYLADDDRLCKMVRSTGAKPQNIKIEIIENALVESPERVGDALKRLKATGFALAIDDFGTGYSSLSYLHRFPMDVLKIDRSFVADLASNPMSLRVVRAIASLAKELSMTVIAEGVETEQALLKLKAIGCDSIQGYLISRPVPLNDALELLQNRSATAIA